MCRRAQIRPPKNMHPFEKKVSDFIAARSLLRPDAGPVIVGLSGGADSVALLAVLTALGYTCIASHCNFHLRGDESERDRRHALLTALRLRTGWEATEFDTRGYCRTRGCGLEEGCRELRYRWFDAIARKHSARAIAVAHHREDQTETFFLNLLRSSGPEGLKGMLPANGRIIRPLLCATRAEILDYLADRGLSFVTDSSNSSADFLRNRLRLNVLPALREAADVDADAAINRAMTHIDESRRLLRSLIDRAAAPYRNLADGSVDIAAIAASEPMAAAFLYQLLAPEGFSRSTTDAILASASESGRRFADNSGRTWLLDRGTLRRYSARSAESSAASTPYRLPLAVSEIEPAQFRPAPGADVIFLDAEAAASPARWELRPWRRGDRIRPFGMKGTRLVSDILSDAKVALDRKESVRVLERDGLILWVAGFRASAHFPVTQSTRRILRIALPDGENSRGY